MGDVEKCFICKSDLKNHAVLGQACNEAYYNNKIRESKGMIGELTKEDHDFMFSPPVSVDEE